MLRAMHIGGMFAALSLIACASTDRLPSMPRTVSDNTAPYAIADARYYPDTDGKQIEDLGRKTIEKERQYLKRRGASSELPPAHFLAISGGGDDGAFGAGVLLGWTANGTRPQFRMVTGISTGALSAPFAFLGPAYDRQLRQVYTKTNASDIFQERGKIVAALAADAMTDTAPLRKMISAFVDETMVRRIREEYGKGRLLLIMTTNLDQARPVIWNIGAIAESAHPRARELIIDVLLASASLPGVFPPVMIDVDSGGQHYQEMHVDGGTTAQAFLYPPTLRLKAASAREAVSRKRTAYIIRNGRLFRAEAEVKRQTLAVAAQAAAAMIAANGLNDMYRIYLITKRDGVASRLTYIDAGFTEPYKGPFDPDYMNKLFNYGYQKMRSGEIWKTEPPGFKDE